MLRSESSGPREVVCPFAAGRRGRLGVCGRIGSSRVQARCVDYGAGCIARIIVPSSAVPGDTVLETVPYLRTFVCSNASRWSDSSVSTRIWYVIDSSRGGMSCFRR